ncbi:hypothetical protein [Streptacidiphilus jiangxiensis]|uniref:Uncharacterized protein n=1 Tax=Streptacidiphilus jiangxiensis TaxID=235985 RepID=A0A1H7T4Z7_STRJI|nr:hypothetical protein [Streptacidiphilus jiangxiensis]SEL79384.1 hypothetical protein SAMN05414137_11355 [Streptacidiphilus jiangxiensis]
MERQQGTRVGIDPGSPFCRLIDAAIEACRDSRESLAQLEQGLVELRDDRLGGAAPRPLGGPERKLHWQHFYRTAQVLKRALADARAEAYRAAVDEQGFTITGLTTYAGNSRQHVSRMVAKGREALEALEAHTE